MPVSLADSHVHLDRYSDFEVAALLRRARAAGVTRVLTVGVDLATSIAAVGIARRRRGVVAAVGVHPTRVRPETVDREVDRLGEIVRSGGVAAVGEIGLDAHGPASPAVQARAFRRLLDLAVEAGLPAVLHVVAAHDMVLEMLQDARRRGERVTGVVHYFVGDAALAERYLAAGCLISVGKPATRPERRALRDAVATIPLDRLLLETDSYPLPGRTTEPRDVALVGAAVAAIKRVAIDEVARHTTANFVRLFGRRSRRDRRA